MEKHYLKPAEYIDGRKVAGLRSLASVQAGFNVLLNHFGKKKLRSITHGEIRAYRAARLRAPTRTGKQRSIASVNRELALLRRMLNIALRECWIIKNPFNAGDVLISVADERKRERILTREEEARLLAACTGRRAHLRPIIIAAIDTGCRLGELLKLRWRDVLSDEGTIIVQAFNTKTMREREVSQTVRLQQEMERLWEASPKDCNGLVFGIENNIKRAFTSARKEAGLDDVRFHDLRHTHGSRLDELGFSLAKIGAQLGHTQLQTTLRYVNRNKAGMRQVATALDSFNIECEAAEAPEIIN